MISFAIPYFKYFSNKWRRILIRFLELPLKGRQHVMYLSPNDSIGSHIQAQGHYETEVLQVIKRIAIHHDLVDGCVLDIGANIGNHTLFFSDFFQKVLSFEPSPVLNLVLKANILRNGIGNVESFDCGLGCQEGSAVVQEVSKDNTGMVQLKVDPDNSSAGLPGRVAVRRGDIIIEQLGTSMPPVRFVKIDVEGMEVPVIHGLSATLKRDCPMIAFESRNYQEGSHVMDILKGLGYQYFSEVAASRFGLRSLPKAKDAFSAVKHYRVQSLTNLEDRHYSVIFAWVREI